MDKSLLGSVALLMMINIVDSITNSIVGPSLIFYVTEMGGSKEQYGMIMSASYLSGILMMSFYGAWVDSNGNRYRAPYAASFVMGMIGSIIYFMASTIRRISGGGWNEGSGVYAILLGRFVTGMGSSGRTLAYTWVATAIPHGEQRNVLTMLSMTRTFGMILGPMLNALIARVDATLVVGSRIVLPITPNNSPGLILFVMEGLLFLSMYAFLEDPPPIATKTGAVSLPSSYENRDHSYAASSKKARAIWNALVSFDVALPMTNLFFMMCNFTFYQVAIPPVAATAYGWSTVRISNVLAAQAIVIFLAMNGAMALSMTGVSDRAMIAGGNFFFVVGGSMTYFWWKVDAATWQFVLPVMLISLAYPFMGPANRSRFTKAVHGYPELENCHGIMQSIFNQMFMIGGFITPNLVTKYGLLSPEQIAIHSSPLVLSSWTWFIPITALLMIIGVVYEDIMFGTNEMGLIRDKRYVETEDVPKTESSALLSGANKVNRRRSSIVTIDQSLSTRYEMDRRASVEAYGIINPGETRDEINLREKLLRDKREWEEIAKFISETGEEN